MPVNHSWSDTHGQAMAPTSTSNAEKNVERKTCALDLDTLDCPICCELLSPPVYQCRNGHTACAVCCKKLITGLCPSCSLPISANRCIVVEKIIESLQVNCKHVDWGCKKMLPYTKGKRKTDEHVEDLCEFRPYHCPVVGCNYEDLDTYFLRHFDRVHNGAILLELSPDDEMKESFTIETGDCEYDQHRSQYVIVHVFKDAGSEVEDHEDEDDEDQIAKDEGSGESIITMFLVHHQFHKKFRMYSFSCTSFGASNMLTQYRLSVDVARTGRFKVNHNIEAPILNNQEDKTVLDKVVQRGDCLLVPELLPTQNGISYEVELSLF